MADVRRLGDPADQIQQVLVQAVGAVLYGSRAPTGSDRLDHRSAVAASDLVVTALPGADVLGVLDEIGDEVLGDRILLNPSATIIRQAATEHTGGEAAARVQTAAATEQAGSLYFAIVRALGDARFNLTVSR
ncbi:hypothetical protein ACH4Y0_41205 [Streptomyces sp. NPDC020707]|uniref:hypothetical protein n=1 Tax=Streptomyces sp. NPDC020707 TaxID=3365084 RepID=UPI0037A09B42